MAAFLAGKGVAEFKDVSPALLRDRGLMMLMLDSGLRVSEALSLEADRID